MPWMPEHLYTGEILRRLDALCAGPDRRQTFLDALIASRSNGTNPQALEVLLADRKFGVLDPVTNAPPTFGVVDPNFRDLTPTELGEWNSNGQLRQHEEDVQVVRTGPPVLVNEQFHMRKDWFTPKVPGGKGATRGGWWDAQVGPVEDIIREGLIQLLQVAQDNNLPTASSWLCAGPDTGTFAVTVQCFVTWDAKQVNFLIQTPEHFGGQMMMRKRNNLNIAGVSYKTAKDIELAKKSGSVVIKADSGGGVFTKPTEFDPSQLGKAVTYVQLQAPIAPTPGPAATPSTRP